MEYGLHPETCRELDLYFNLELLHIDEKGAGDDKTTVGVAKNSMIRTKNINRKLVIVRVSSDMFNFVVLVVIVSIYDVEMLNFESK